MRNENFAYLRDFDEFDQVPYYNAAEERADELASQLYAMETKVQNLKREVEFYKNLWEIGLAPISSYV
jgi:hypothetical protein